MQVDFGGGGIKLTGLRERSNVEIGNDWHCINSRY